MIWVYVSGLPWALAIAAYLQMVLKILEMGFMWK